MNPRASVLLLSLVLFVTPIVQAQTIYTYMSHYKLPRASFQEASEFADQAAAGFEQLVADGTVIHWGIDEAFVHTSNGHTHGTWFAATSLEGIDKTLSALQAQGGGGNPLGAAAEEHHDHLLRSLAHGGKTSNIRDGYVRTNISNVKLGMGREWRGHAEAAYKPVFDAMVADGTILVWEISTDAIHTGDAGNRYIWYVTADAAGQDKVQAAIAKHRSEHPGPIAAVRASSSRDGHRDGLSLVHFQHK